ncbi:MAG: acetyl-CoA carboxylase biotin carboxyl carrier protein [Flavobacteriaceae bacterium]|jgi:acetyl-CoA carboxylase biotin carboxyl carrier protein|nr:acetyl-CoA carboxylase biotin carboxyl carrier protein [Flavobacteriaceae bacterium]
MRIKEIKNLIKFVAKAGAREVSIETEKLKLTIKAGEKTIIQQAPVVELPAISEPKQSAPPPLAKEQDAASEEESKYLTIKAPIIGTFYRKPSPDKPAFVEIGDSVSEGSVLCVIEAMKLFNEIESEVSGKIVKVLVEDSTPVEFDQPLFLIDPS